MRAQLSRARGCGWLCVRMSVRVCGWAEGGGVGGRAPCTGLVSCAHHPRPACSCPHAPRTRARWYTRLCPLTPGTLAVPTHTWLCLRLPGCACVQLIDFGLSRKIPGMDMVELLTPAARRVMQVPRTVPLASPSCILHTHLTFRGVLCWPLSDAVAAACCGAALWCCAVVLRCGAALWVCAVGLRCGSALWCCAVGLAPSASVCVWFCHVLLDAAVGQRRTRCARAAPGGQTRQQHVADGGAEL